MINQLIAETDKSDYSGHPDYLNFKIDGVFLDEHLDQLYPGLLYKGLIPTLLFGMEVEAESDIVWQRILPEENQASICPILMCPDDNDFSCTIIVAEIKRNKDTISWDRLGVDQTTDFHPHAIGSQVQWFSKPPALKFSVESYHQMLSDFKVQFEVKKEEREIKRKAQRESSKNQMT